MNEIDVKYLKRCLELAKEAQSKGESPVGAVIVQHNKVVGEGLESSKRQGDITRHAEVVAILNALQQGQQIVGATLYTNKEPCLLCSYVIRHHKIGRVVFSEHSGPLGGTSSPFNILTTDELSPWGKPPAVDFIPFDDDL